MIKGELFLNIDDALQRAKSSRKKIDPNKLPKYYLPYFDDVLFGIAPAELVVIGADTGVGKTHLANHLALYNARRGKKVYLFSLEGHEDEVVNRWKWQIICREYYKNPRCIDMQYAKYEMNMLKGLEYEEKIANDELSEIGNNIKIYDRSTQLDVNVLSQQLDLIQDADLVVIDHLHYFNILDSKTETENISMIMRSIKDLTEEYKTPVVLVSHLRKRDRKTLPDNDDFHGSSNIAKIASTCLMVSNNTDNHDIVNSRYSTILRVSKSRSGASTFLAGEVFFNAKDNKYEEGYKLGKIITGVYKTLDYVEYPKWAEKQSVPDIPEDF